MTAPKISPERIAELRKLADTWPKDPGEISNALEEAIDAIEALQAERDRLREDMQSVADGNASHRGMNTELGRELYSVFLNLDEALHSTCTLTEDHPTVQALRHTERERDRYREALEDMAHWFTAGPNSNVAASEVWKIARRALAEREEE